MVIQISAIYNVEAKKKYEFLDAVSGAVAAHLMYFKQVCCCRHFCRFKAVKCNLLLVVSLQGYDLLHQMEPFIEQVVIFNFVGK